MSGSYRSFCRLAMAGALASLVAGCAMTGASSSRGDAAGDDARRGGPIYLASQYDVAEITVEVPTDLVVSEANSYYPDADIVWRGEALGDRHAQVADIVAEAVEVGTEVMTEGREVDVLVRLTRFHAVTEITRYTFGGVHAVQFVLEVRDHATGALIDGPREVVANAPASGGQKALDEDQAGRTQRVVIVERVAEAVRRALSREVSVPVALAAN
jgi:hypothetical protein